ncbi:MAG: permease-like cell division protein FtsX [Lachnospiraceae bacterium]|nr:permease-like cell division protein FtsX [Lachnospiraceae bacterium]
MRNLPYMISQSFKGIRKHLGTSLFSLAIMVFTIFLFDGAAAILLNLGNFVKEAEENVGITVFFREGLSEQDIKALGEQISASPEVRRVKYTSAEEAWENYKKIYFAGNEKLAEGFADNNPLANSASYEIFLEDMSGQKMFAVWLEGLPGVRKVNVSNAVTGALQNASSLIRIGTVVILAVLVVVAVVLIANGIAMTISQRQEQIHIMRYMGATNGFIRGPFLIEGALIGLLGALIPLLITWFGYPPVVEGIRNKYVNLANIFAFLPRQKVFAVIIPVSLALSLGIGLAGSAFSIKKHLKV